MLPLTVNITADPATIKDGLKYTKILQPHCYSINFRSPLYSEQQKHS
jgi:hypothetical protein